MSPLPIKEPISGTCSLVCLTTQNFLWEVRQQATVTYEKMQVISDAIFIFLHRTLGLRLTQHAECHLRMVHRVVDILRNEYFEKYLEWGPFLVCFYIQWCTGFSPPIVVFKSYVETSTKAQTNLFVKKNWNDKGCLTHCLKEENKIFPKSYFLPREADCKMAIWPLIGQIACIFLKMIRSFWAPGFMIESRLPTSQKILGIWK